jgi:hypothetical protein
MNHGITRSMLTDSLIMGTTIDLYFNMAFTDLWVLARVRVTGIYLESGSAKGEAARSFMVKATDGLGFNGETYVRTID